MDSKGSLKKAIESLTAVIPTLNQRCKNLGSVVALLQGNLEKSHDFKAKFEEKHAVLMGLQKLDDNFLPLNLITKLMSKNSKTFDHTHTFHGQT